MTVAPQISERPRVADFGASERARQVRSLEDRRRPKKRVKLAARSLQGRIAVVRQHSSVWGLITWAPGWTGRRSLSAIR